jgi:hypothetical protein
MPVNKATRTAKTPAGRRRSTMPINKATRTAAEQLARFFLRNGYVRRHNPQRRAEVGSQVYKKGNEVRLTAESREELRLIRRLLRKTGFTPGRPFDKGRQYRQPIYGSREVARFLELIGETHVMKEISIPRS